MPADPSQQPGALQGDTPDSSLMGTHVGLNVNASGAEGGEIFQTLSELESRLSGLKKLHEQHTRREAAIVQREQDLARREAEQRVKNDTLERQRAEVSGAWKELRREQGELQLERSQLAELVTQSDRRAGEAGERLARAAEAETAIVAKLKSAEEREAASLERERTASESAARVQAAEAALREREARVGESERRAAEVEAQFAENQRRAEELRVEGERASAARAEAEAIRAELEASRRAESEAQRLHDERRAELERELASRQDELYRQGEELRRERANVEEQSRALAAKAADFETSAIHAGRIEELELQLGEAVNARTARERELSVVQGESESLRRELEGSKNELELARSAAEDVRRSVGASTGKLEAELEEARERAEKSEDALREVLTRSESSLSALKAEVERLRAQAGERDAEIRTLREEAGAASSGAAALGELEARASTLEGELEAARAQNAELLERQRVLEQAATSKPATATPEEISKRDQAIVLLKQRFDEARTLNQELQTRVERAERAERAAADAGPGTGGGAGVPPLRRERLRRYKALLQSQARKIVTAQNALQKRHTDAELVLAQRQKIASAAAELSRVEKRINSGRARNGAAALMLYCTATLAVLAVLSWGVSRQIWPGTYAVRAVVQAEAGGRMPTPEELKAWQEYHEQLVKDPRLVELAAERMNRRGIEDLGNAPALHARLNKDLYTQSSGQGSLTVELRGEGASKTAIELDTYITALKTVADTSREQRSTPLTTVIAQAATPDPSPMKSDHLTKAAMLLAGGAAGVGLFGVAVWSRLARSKRKFEQAQAVEAALDEVDWATLEKTIVKSGKERR
jgi:hypothetical protein